MLSEVPYATLANYSPRGRSELSQRSRAICGGFKAGKENVIRSALPHVGAAATLRPFLNENVTLVPVPRSAPLADGALWPAQVIAEILVDGGFGDVVMPCLERVSAVPKSAAVAASERPLWHAHYESIAVHGELIKPAHLTLIDDVLTMGRTTFACARRLEEEFPEAEIRVFAVIRTQGFKPDIDDLVDPSVGTITGYPSGKTMRDP